MLTKLLPNRYKILSRGGFDSSFILGTDGDKEVIHTFNECKKKKLTKNNLRKFYKSTHQHSNIYPPPQSWLYLCNHMRNALVPTSAYTTALQQAECRHTPVLPAHSASCFLRISNVLLVLCLLLLSSFCCYKEPLKIAM